jgi:hypothetical protein
MREIDRVLTDGLDGSEIATCGIRCDAQSDKRERQAAIASSLAR